MKFYTFYIVSSVCIFAETTLQYEAAQTDTVLSLTYDEIYLQDEDGEVQAKHYYTSDFVVSNGSGWGNDIPQHTLLNVLCRTESAWSFASALWILCYLLRSFRLLLFNDLLPSLSYDSRLPTNISFVPKMKFKEVTLFSGIYSPHRRFYRVVVLSLYYLALQFRVLQMASLAQRFTILKEKFADTSPSSSSSPLYPHIVHFCTLLTRTLPKYGALFLTTIANAFAQGTKSKYEDNLSEALNEFPLVKDRCHSFSKQSSKSEEELSLFNKYRVNYSKGFSFLFTYEYYKKEFVDLQETLLSQIVPNSSGGAVTKEDSSEERPYQKEDIEQLAVNKKEIHNTGGVDREEVDMTGSEGRLFSLEAIDRDPVVGNSMERRFLELGNNELLIESPDYQSNVYGPQQFSLVNEFSDLDDQDKNQSSMFDLENFLPSSNYDQEEHLKPLFQSSGTTKTNFQPFRSFEMMQDYDNEEQNTNIHAARKFLYFGNELDHSNSLLEELSSVEEERRWKNTGKYSFEENTAEVGDYLKIQESEKVNKNKPMQSNNVENKVSARKLRIQHYSNQSFPLKKGKTGIIPQVLSAIDSLHISLFSLRTFCGRNQKKFLYYVKNDNLYTKTFFVEMTREEIRNPNYASPESRLKWSWNLFRETLPPLLKLLRESLQCSVNGIFGKEIPQTTPSIDNDTMSEDIIVDLQERGIWHERMPINTMKWKKAKEEVELIILGCLEKMKNGSIGETSDKMKQKYEIKKMYSNFPPLHLLAPMLWRYITLLERNNRLSDLYFIPASTLSSLSSLATLSLSQMAPIAAKRKLKMKRELQSSIADDKERVDEEEKIESETNRVERKEISSTHLSKTGDKTHKAINRDSEGTDLVTHDGIKRVLGTWDIRLEVPLMSTLQSNLYYSNYRKESTKEEMQFWLLLNHAPQDISGCFSYALEGSKFPNEAMFLHHNPVYNSLDEFHSVPLSTPLSFAFPSRLSTSLFPIPPTSSSLPVPVQHPIIKVSAPPPPPRPSQPASFSSSVSLPTQELVLLALFRGDEPPFLGQYAWKDAFGCSVRQQQCDGLSYDKRNLAVVLNKTFLLNRRLFVEQDLIEKRKLASDIHLNSVIADMGIPELEKGRQVEENTNLEIREWRAIDAKEMGVNAKAPSPENEEESGITLTAAEIGIKNYLNVPEKNRDLWWRNGTIRKGLTVATFKLLLPSVLQHKTHIHYARRIQMYNAKLRMRLILKEVLETFEEVLFSTASAPTPFLINKT